MERNNNSNQQQQAMTKSRRRRVRRRVRKAALAIANNNAASKKTKIRNGIYSSGSGNQVVQAPATAPIPSNRYTRAQMMAGLRASELANSVKVTPDGISFLKCAFAPPDFSYISNGGVPDSFQGKSLVKKHKFVESHVFSANYDTYYLLLPTPGYAYHTLSVPLNTAIDRTMAWTGIEYSDCEGLFNPNHSPGDNVADIFNKFRYISNHFEIIPTVNSTQWTGSIQAWRMPIQVIVRPDSGVGDTGFNILSVTGLQAANATNVDQYSGPLNLGVFTAAYNRGCDFAFNPIQEGTVDVPSTILNADFGKLVNSQGFTGFDQNFDSVLIKVSGMGDNTKNSVIIKTWATVEYQVVPGSPLYEYQSISPHDPTAMEIYRKVINELPVGVTFLDNSEFWKRVLDVVKRITNAGATLPGPYGLISGGINTAIQGIESLII